MGGVIITLNRGMGERLMYGILARYRVVLIERLGGFFFDGRRSCIKDSFAGHSGLYCGDYLTVSCYTLAYQHTSILDKKVMPKNAVPKY